MSGDLGGEKVIGLFSPNDRLAGRQEIGTWPTEGEYLHGQPHGVERREPSVRVGEFVRHACRSEGRLAGKVPTGDGGGLRDPGHQRRKREVFLDPNDA